MNLEELRLFQFRNLADQSLSFSPEANLLIGQNGQGKTNLIEAISILGGGRSFRTADLSELVAHGRDAFSVFGRVRQAASDMELGCSLDRKGRHYFADGKELNALADFIGRFVCVAFSPDDLHLVKGSPQLRRRFLDKHIVDRSPGLLVHYAKYNKALANKNILLKEAFPEGAAIESWNQILAAAALPIWQARHAFIRELEEESNQFLSEFGAPDGKLEIRHARKPEVTDERELLQKLSEARPRELRQKTSVLGPHRDDMEILLDGRRADSFASQGQIRSIVLALKLGVLSILDRTSGDPPVVLLDDVDSELDPMRSRRLYMLVANFRRQIFISATALSEPLRTFQDRGLVMSVSGGKIGNAT